MPTREDCWLSPAGGGCTNDWAGVEKLLDSDAPPDAVYSGLEQDYWGPATGAHFWGAPTCPVRRPIAVAVPVTSDPAAWKKSEPAAWQQKAKEQYSDYYKKQVSASCWSLGPLADSGPLVPVRPQKNEAAMITGVVTTDASASMITAAQHADIARAATQDLASGLGHDRVHVDEISGPQLRLHVRLSSSWAESDPLFSKLRQACMKLALGKMQEAYRKATGLGDSQVSVIGSSCLFSTPRVQHSIIGSAASSRLSDWAKRKSPADLAWACAAGSISQDALARSITRAPAAHGKPSVAPRPAVPAAVGGGGTGVKTVSPAVPRAQPVRKTPLGTTAAPQTDEEKKALLAKRQALLASKLKPKTADAGAADKGGKSAAAAAAPAPAPAAMPKTMPEIVSQVKRLLTVGTYFRGGITFVGEVGGVLQKHFENYELMIDAWDDQTKMLRGWHNHSSRLREVRRNCSVRCWKRDSQLLVQIKDELMTCKGKLTAMDTFQGEVTLTGFTGKFVLTKDELGPSE
eukprot:Hpha_TRINITY_DN13110_c0_g1::TRINITY_DN13110_c0_g1_i1::g.113599::m.113599